MTRFFKKLFVCLSILFVLTWLTSIFKCEIYTYELKDELLEVDGVPVSINGGKYKVLYCNKNYAYVYWHNDEFGHTLSFIRGTDGKWKFYKFEICIWSRSGSADGFIWPYIR